jgi:vacuolar protein sorting-associated protein 26
MEIRLDPPPPPHQIALDHHPSWKLHKNPFWRVKHPAGNRLQPLTNTYYPSAAGTPAVPPPSPQYASSSASSQYASSDLSLGQHQSGKDPIYVHEGAQVVQGTVVLRLPPGGSGKKVEHLGVRIMFLGRIDMSVGIHEGKPSYDVASLSKELSPPGAVYQDMVLPFKFTMDKELESYRGRNVSVRYVLKVSVDRKFLPPLTHERDVWVQLLGNEPEIHEPIKMEVGIEDCLHIEFEYERRMYHLRDVIRGKIHFLLVRIKIKHMELAVIRRETSGEGVAVAMAATEGNAQASSAPSAANSSSSASNICTETQTLVKYEIMDGAPVKDEVIPVKLSLEGIPADLTPTYTAVNNRFSVRYYLNLVLVDEDDRRYFKQQEIILWRKELG